MRISAFPQCCGVAVVSHFGFDQRHAHRPENRDQMTLAQTQAQLERYARDARTGIGGFVDIGSVGMLVCALNNHQRDHLHDMLIRLGWRRAGKCNNLHTGGDTNIYMYRKVIEEERDLV